MRGACIDPGQGSRPPDKMVGPKIRIFPSLTGCVAKHAYARSLPSAHSKREECFSAIRARSNAPKGLEPGRGEFGITNRVLDVLVPEIGLKGTGIVALGSQREPTGMPQHVWVRLEGEACLRARALDHAREACGGEGRAALGREHKGRLRLLLALQPAKGAQLVPEDRMGAGAALLDPADVQRRRGEVDLIPAQVRQLAGPKAMPVGHQDHRGVPVRPSVALGGPEKPFDLGLRQVFAPPQVGVGAALRCNCSIYGAWGHQPEM